MFDSIPGQERARRYFAEVLERGPGHAYLLAGEDGLGKRAFALELGTALVTACGGCGACDDCARAARGVHPDLMIVEREGEQIRIEQVGRVIADLALKPFASSRRVWIIPEADKFNVPAANTFLKSLEEPPAHVHFVLVTSNLDRVLPTIVSRCQVVDFRPVPDAVLAEHLERHRGLDAGEAEVVARLSRGSVARAARLLADTGDEPRRDRYLRLAAGVVLHDREAERRFVEEVQTAEQAAAAHVSTEFESRADEVRQATRDDRDQAWRLKILEGQARRETLRVSRLACFDALDFLASWLHDVWAVGLGGEAVVWNRDKVADLRHGSVARPELYARLLDVVGQTRKDVYLNVDRGLALRAMFARFEEVWEGA